MMRLLFSIHDKESGSWTEVITANSLAEVVTQLRRSPDHHVYKQFADQFELVYLADFSTYDDSCMSNFKIIPVEDHRVSFSDIFLGKDATLVPEVKTDD